MTVLRSTHQLHLADDVVTKRFTSWGRGEALREWRGLTLLHRYAPGIAPAPLAAALDAKPPEVTMSRIDGTPLRGTVVSWPALRALARTLSAVHRAVPGQAVAAIPTGAWHARRVDTHVRGRLAGRPDGPWEPVVREALAVGERWLAGARLETVSGADAVHPVFGLTDGNLANYLYDGARVRLLDFEDAGRSDRAFELAEISSHLSTWVDSTFDVEFFLGLFPLTEAESARIEHLRRLNALLWLGNLLSDTGTPRRNPPGTAERQAERLLALL